MVQRPISHPATDRVAFADCVLDPAARYLWRAGDPVHLQPKVMELLLCLFQHRDRFLSKQELQQALWGSVVVSAASLPRLVKELRRALGDPAEQPRLIRTLHGRGYQFIGGPAAVPANSAESGEVEAHGSAREQDMATAAVLPLRSLEATRTGSETGMVDRPLHCQLRTLHPEDMAPFGSKRALGRASEEPAPLGTAPLRIGRSAECDLILPFEGVSRQHAELALVGPAYTLRDLGSRNGVFVDGEKLLAPAVLRCGQIVRIDGWVGMLEPVPQVALLGARAEPRALTRTSPRASALHFGPHLGALLDPLTRADADAILLEGETGTGKSALARALHAWSRRTGPLLVVGCSPGADADQESSCHGPEALASAFAAARAGTLVLEDVDALSPAQQDELHALWAESEARHVKQAPLRVLATAQSSCHARVLAGQFRADLYVRFRTLTLTPLRARVQDIPGLFRHALDAHSGGQVPEVSPRLIEALCLYDWPFNVRELQLVARDMLLANPAEPRLSRRHLPPALSGQPSAASHEFLVSALGDALRESEGDLERAAASTGVSSPDARRLLRQVRASRQIESGRAFRG